jgi:hypothetical protein
MSTRQTGHRYPGNGEEVSGPTRHSELHRRNAMLCWSRGICFWMPHVTFPWHQFPDKCRWLSSPQEHDPCMIPLFTNYACLMLHFSSPNVQNVKLRYTVNDYFEMMYRKIRYSKSSCDSTKSGVRPTLTAADARDTLLVALSTCTM